GARRQAGHTVANGDLLTHLGTRIQGRVERGLALGQTGDDSVNPGIAVTSVPGGRIDQRGIEDVHGTAPSGGEPHASQLSAGTDVDHGALAGREGSGIEVDAAPGPLRLFITLA